MPYRTHLVSFKYEKIPCYTILCVKNYAGDVLTFVSQNCPLFHIFTPLTTSMGQCDPLTHISPVSLINFSFSFVNSYLSNISNVTYLDKNVSNLISATFFEIVILRHGLHNGHLLFCANLYLVNEITVDMACIL